MALNLMYITNSPEIAKLVQYYGADWVFVDLETLGKEERQKGRDSVKSQHTEQDVAELRKGLTTSKLLVRVNPFNPDSEREINSVIDKGADIVMLPMWKSVEDVQSFVSYVGGRVETLLLLETKEGCECLDDVLEIPGISRIHIGLNDLHLSYGMTFMFELLADGTVDEICSKIKAKGIPYGFGGVARVGEGNLPAERIIMEHYRLGSSMVILSRSFCDVSKCKDLDEVESIFKNNVYNLREFEKQAALVTPEEFAENHTEIVKCVAQIVDSIKNKNNGN
jgi:2-keto-3-deoxy-L-rhamnonate aldolase RhmA